MSYAPLKYKQKLYFIMSKEKIIINVVIIKNISSLVTINNTRDTK